MKASLWSGLKARLRHRHFPRRPRLEAGYLLRLLQEGESLGLPHSRPMPSIGGRCHELRIHDESGIVRIVYRVDHDAIVILEVWKKKTQQTPQAIITACERRLRGYDEWCDAEE